MIPNKQKPSEIIGVIVTIAIVAFVLVVLPTQIDLQGEPPPTKACNCIPNPFAIFYLLPIAIVISIIIMFIPKTVKQ